MPGSLQYLSSLFLKCFRPIILWVFIGGLSTLSAQPHFPGDPRADSLEIPEIHLRLDLSDFNTPTLYGHATLHVVPRFSSMQHADFDLLNLQIDSLAVNNSAQNPLIFPPHHFRVPFPAYQLGDTLRIEVFYHGTPTFDPAFGGFYFNQGYAYNIGVSLSQIPHQFAKTWFPCLDNFQTRSRFYAEIITQSTHQAVAGGIRTAENTLPDGKKSYRYELHQPLPPYLMSVAVSDYSLVEYQIPSISGGNIPVQLAARAPDTTNFKNSAVNLPTGFQIFEQLFGPYPWDRVGYVLVPITAGAMEHATNIAYPRILANGNLAYQDVLMHELAHSWWGNLATCRTAEDMWLNEGWAVYSEWLFNEFFSGKNQYMNLYRSTHKTNLRTAHIEDAGHWPLSGVPDAHTYGYHSYSKAADFIHTLRHYLGDSLFFSGIRQALERNRFADWDAAMFRDTLSAATGQNLQDFFEHWIFQPGWPHFALDSFYTDQGICHVFIRQRLNGRTQFCSGVPLSIGLLMPDWSIQKQTVTVDQELNHFQIPVNQPPIQIIVNENEGLSDATTAQAYVIKNTGNLNLTYANISLNIQQVTDSVWFRAIQHWTPADWDPAGNQVSPQRWWTIQMEPAGKIKGTASLTYNGRTAGNDSHLDHLLIPDREDSIMLLWRPGVGTHWIEYPYYTAITGGLIDKFGTIRLDSILPGDYCFAMRNMAVSFENIPENRNIYLFPNPVQPSGTLQLSVPDEEPAFIHWYSIDGKWAGSTAPENLNVPPLKPGIYITDIWLKSGKRLQQRMVVQEE